MSLVPHQIAFLLDISNLIQYSNRIGVNLTIGDAYRNIELQSYYVKQGLSWTLDSNHLKRLAIDFNFFIDGKLCYRHSLITMVGEYWESLDHRNRWGGNFKRSDTPHFERNV